MSKKILFSIIVMLLVSVASVAGNGRFTLVIDAGHGGSDYGAPGAISQEKDLTLKYALAFGKIIERNCPDVKVFYTRTTDVFVPLSERADIANRKKADLFVSVHINALAGGRQGHGYQTYTLGRSLRNGNSQGIEQNLEVAKRENSVIFMEKDYKKTYSGLDQNSAESDIVYEFIQDQNREHSTELAKYLQNSVCATTGRQNGEAHQDNLAVLRLTSMPGCLMELGFISTPDEEEYLNSDAAVDAYSRGFYNAIMKYRSKYDSNLSVPYKAIPNTPDLPQVVPDTYRQVVKKGKEVISKSEQGKPEAKSVQIITTQVDEDKPVFKIQFMASSRKLLSGDVHFKSLTGCDSYEEGNMIKYTYGSSNNYNEIYKLRKQILEEFPEAFIIAFKNGKKMNVNEAIMEFKMNKKK